jgi:hypothetical protein
MVADLNVSDKAARRASRKAAKSTEMDRQNEDPAGMSRGAENDNYSKADNGGTHNSGNGSAQDPDDRSQHSEYADKLERILRDGENNEFGGDKGRALWFVICEMLRRRCPPLINTRCSIRTTSFPPTSTPTAGRGFSSSNRSPEGRSTSRLRDRSYCRRPPTWAHGRPRSRRQ